MQPLRQTSASLRARKDGQKIVAITAYTAPMAALLDPLVDVLLVGDSLGMVIYGLPTTLSVTLDMMIAHGRAVASHARQALVVVDMPFGSYQASLADAFAASARVMQETGCGAVKLEGGVEMADTIRFLVERGVPVVGHVGLQPQHVHRYGGYRAQGRDAAARTRIMKDALAVEEAGACCIVLESMPESLGREITKRLHIPTIGIGASPACDGQVLVLDDMLGITPRVPSFVKCYARLREQVEQAVRTYAGEVRSGAFPDAAHYLTSGEGPRAPGRPKARKLPKPRK